MSLVKKVLDMQHRTDKITLAVYMIAYNHSSYIAKAVESVMMQQTNLEYKLFIGEDCSTDDTREICLKFKDLYPEKIELILNNKNIGATLNAKNTYSKCIESGAKYVAMLEGDDYWTDPLKLQKQVNFLEQNPEYNVVGGASKVYLENLNTFRKSKVIDYQNGTLSIIEYLFKRPFHTSTIMCRNQFKLPEWFSGIYPGDKFIVAFAADKKKLKVLDDELSVYRVNEGGITSNLTKYKVTELLKKTNYGLSKLYDYIPKSDHNQLRKLINHNEVLIQFGSANRLNKFIVFVKYFSFLYENRNWINWKVFLSRLK